MTPQAQQEYYLVSLGELTGFITGITEERIKLAKEIRSRPAPAPETCKKYWNYRADSGHLYHLLYDLLGVMPTPETLGDALMQVRDRDTAIRKAERERVLEILHCLRNALEEKEMRSDVSLPQSIKFGAGRVVIEGAIRMIL